MLRKRFPEIITFEEFHEPCNICRVEEFNRLETEKAARNELQVESTILSRMGRVAKLAVITEHKFYAIPTIFVEQLRKYMNDPHDASKPEVIDTTVLICQHNQFCFDPEADNTDMILYWTVIESDWSYFVRNYRLVGPEIVMRTQQGADSVIMCPEIGWCQPCRVATVSNYTSANILVVKRIPQQDSSAKLAIEPKKRSTRKATIKPATRQQVTITPTMTLRDLMLKIEPTFKAHPLYQKMYKNNVELEAMDATLKEHGILPGDRLEVEIYNQGLQDFEDEEQAAHFEAGFKGTMLQDLN